MAKKNKTNEIAKIKGLTILYFVMFLVYIILLIFNIADIIKAYPDGSARVALSNIIFVILSFLLAFSVLMDYIFKEEKCKSEK